MKRILLTLAALLSAGPAVATELLWMPNSAGGEIVLTDVRGKACENDARIAFTRAPDGFTLTGCWTYTDSGYVFIKWIESGSLKTFKLTDFRLFNDQVPLPHKSGKDMRL